MTLRDVTGCAAVSATDPAVLTAMLQTEATRQAAVNHVWRSQMRHALDGVDEVDVAIAAASASEALYGPELPEASWAGAVENFLADAAVTSAQIALAPLMWEPDAPAVRWAGELEAHKNPYKVREEDRAMQTASEWVVIGAAIVFEPGAAAGAASLVRGGLGQLKRLGRAVLRRMRGKADDAVKPAVRLAHKVDLSAGGEYIDDGIRSVDQPLADGAAEGGVKIPWGTWDDYAKVTIDGQELAQVGNRLYTRHAVDRLQPSGLRFNHAGTGKTGGLPQIRQAKNTDYGRSVAPQYVEDAIQSSRGVVQPNGNISHTSGDLQVILNPQGHVVTVITH